MNLWKCGSFYFLQAILHTSPHQPNAWNKLTLSRPHTDTVFETSSKGTPPIRVRRHSQDWVMPFWLKAWTLKVSNVSALYYIYTDTVIDYRYSHLVLVTNLHISRISLVKCLDNRTDQRWVLIKNIFHFCWHITVSMMKTVLRFLWKPEVIKK